MKKNNLGRLLFVIINTAVLLLIALISIYPMYYSVVISFSESNKVMGNAAFVWKPLGVSFAAYKAILADSRISTGYINTLFVVVVGTCVNILLTSMAAYFLSRKNVMFRRGVMVYIIITMYFSGGMVPTFLLVKGIGLYDSIWSLILPSAVSAFNLIVLRTGFDAIPGALTEAAEIDGAGPWRILFTIIYPTAKATIAVVVLYYAVDHWNSWFSASIYLRSPEKFPLQLFLRNILLTNSGASMTDDLNAGSERIAETIQFAVIVVSTVPILCIYPFVQKYFAEGVMIGAVKG